MNFYKFHLGDYYKKTSHLSMLEDGAYRRLMDAIYLREGPLPQNKEQVYRLARAFTDAEKDAVDVVLAEFFILTDAGYTNARCDAELASVRSKSAKAAESAGRRWGGADAMPTHVPTHVPTHMPTHMPTHSEGNASHKPVTSSQESSSTARASEPVTNLHRMMAADLLDRGKADLSSWERKFLESLCAKSVLTDKMRVTMDGIASKIGLTADTVITTWRKRLEVARRLRQWDAKWGPPPRTIGCLVPDEMLEPGDGVDWEEWRAAS